MSTQLDMFYPLPFQRDSMTSRAAAESVRTVAGPMAQSILDLLRVSAGGLTREEIHQALGFKESTVCARVNQLMRLGLVRMSGQRNTSAGRPADVVVAA